MFSLCSIRDITKEVAAAVVKEAIEEDLAEGYREMDARELQKLNQACPWTLAIDVIADYKIINFVIWFFFLLHFVSIQNW